MNLINRFLVRVRNAAIGFGSAVQRWAVRAVVVGMVFGFTAATRAAAFVTYDAQTQDVTFAPGELVAKVINSAVGAITAGIPLLLLGMVFAYILKTLGWVGAKKK